jgi:hypothetical protein
MSSTAPVTTPATTAPAPATGLVASWAAFIKAHEKMVIIAVTGVLAFHLTSVGISAWTHHDDVLASKANAVVQVDDSKTVALAQQLVTMQKEMNAQNVALTQAIAQRTQATQVQIKTDAAMPLPDLAGRWSNLLTLPPADFSADAAGNISVNSEGAHATVTQLEQVPTLSANNAALTAQLSNQTAVMSKQVDASNACTTELADEKKAHVADVAAAKAQSKKSWLKGFKWGFGSGFLTGLFAGHHGV